MATISTTERPAGAALPAVPELSAADLRHLLYAISPEALAAGRTGKYQCTRCGWRWTPRPGSPDPPRCCAFRYCHSPYWDKPPRRSTARRPEERPSFEQYARLKDWNARRRKQRDLAKMRQVAEEFGLKVVPRDTTPADAMAPRTTAPAPTIPPPPGMRTEQEGQ